MINTVHCIGRYAITVNVRNAVGALIGDARMKPGRKPDDEGMERQ